MLTRSRRKAREAALRALYQIDIVGTLTEEALGNVHAAMQLPRDLTDYTDRLVRGVRARLREIDGGLKPLVRDYDYSRLAAVDRNILRIAAYELLAVPEIPPAVTLNEAIEIAKKYSMAESGRFVNGVLGNFLKTTEKANWNPATAPSELDEAEPEPEEEPEVPAVEEVEVAEDSKEVQQARRFGWILRAGDREIPPLTEGS